MPRLLVEPLVFCLAWAGVALTAGALAGWKAGAALSLGLLLVMMPVSSLILTRTESFQAERLVRWGILAMAAVGFALWVQGG